MNIPFPPTPFPDPEIGVARKDFPIYLEDNTDIEGYIRKADDDHRLAYARIEKRPIDLPNGKGKIIYGRVYERIDRPEPIYRPTEDLVVIKKFSKAFLRNQVIRASREGRMISENPNIEIAASQLVGNNVNVVSIHEALEDTRYLYMIMPYFGSDLLDELQLGIRMRPPQLPNSPRLLRTLVRNLLYLEEHRVLHRDLSPENIIVNKAHGEDRCPLIDFAMALRCTVVEGNVMPITSQPRCGKLPYMSPEVANGEPLTNKIDVWALGVTLFYIWTRRHLYDFPTPTDLSWRYFLRDGGLERDQFDALPHWNDVGQVPREYFPVIDKIMAVQELSASQRHLLTEMLRLNPDDRIKTRDILAHRWFNEPQQEE